MAKKIRTSLITISITRFYPSIPPSRASTIILHLYRPSIRLLIAANIRGSSSILHTFCSVQSGMLTPYAIGTGRNIWLSLIRDFNAVGYISTLSYVFMAWCLSTKTSLSSSCLQSEMYDLIQWLLTFFARHPSLIF
jgi:hypothetical protein